MRILFVSEFFWPRPAGGEVWAVQLCEGLVKQGHEVTVFTTRHARNLKKRETHAGIEIHRPVQAGTGRIMRKLAVTRLTQAVRKHLRAQKPDVIHVLGFPLHVPIAMVAEKHHIPCVISVHSFFGKEWRRISRLWPLLEFLERSYITRPHAIFHVPSAYTGEKIASSTGKGAKVIHNWCPDIFPEPKPNPDAYLFVGSLERIKNPLACLDACKGRPLIVIGNGSLRKELEQQAKAKGVDLTLHKTMERDAVLAHIAGAGCLLVPSHSESFSLVALEAIAQGTPVSGNPVGILPELPGVVAFPPNGMPRRCSDRTVNEIRKRFSYAKQVHAFIDLYNETKTLKSERRVEKR